MKDASAAVARWHGARPRVSGTTGAGKGSRLWEVFTCRSARKSRQIVSVILARAGTERAQLQGHARSQFLYRG